MIVNYLFGEKIYMLVGCCGFSDTFLLNEKAEYILHPAAFIRVGEFI